MANNVSIILMVRDAGPILTQFLARIASQRTSFSYELIVLYFGTGSESYAKLEEAGAQIVRIEPSEFDFGRSRDLVCGRAQGQYLVSVSVDALPVRDDWLDRLITPLLSGEADVIQGGINCPKRGNKTYGEYFYWEQGGLFTYTREGDNFFREHGGTWLSCVNIAFRREVWVQTGFEGASFCEDKLFQKRVYMHGFRMVYLKEAAVEHAHNYPTIRSLFNRVANEGLGWREVGERYGISLMIQDLLRFDLHYLAAKALLRGELKYPSEVLFFLIRPIALFWGNHQLKQVNR